MLPCPVPAHVQELHLLRTKIRRVSESGPGEIYGFIYSRHGEQGCQGRAEPAAFTPRLTVGLQQQGTLVVSQPVHDALEITSMPE